MSHKEEDEWVPLTAVRLLNLYSRKIVLSVNNNQDILFSLSVCSYEWEQTELLFEHQWLMQSYHPQHVCVCVVLFSYICGDPNQESRPSREVQQLYGDQNVAPRNELITF